MALPTASDNPYPSILITEGTEPSAPAAGKQRLYIDSTTHKLKRTDSSGTDVTIEGVAAGAVTSSGLTMATARMLGRTTASTGAIEEITVGTGLSLSAGALTATGGSAVGNLWKMSISSSVTLTNATATVITFDRNDIDGGSSVIDLANDRFVVPATGFYQVICDWLWESTAPLANCSMAVTVGGTDTVLFRVTSPTTFAADSGYNATQAMSLSSGAFVKMTINPQAVTGCTARGNAAARLSTSMTLIRIT